MNEVAPSSSEVFSEKQTKHVQALSQKIFGRDPKRVAFPGGTSRAAFIADMEDALYFFAKREDKDEAQLEGIVLRAMGPKGLTPNLKTVEGDWVVQEFIDGVRLPVAMDQTEDMAERERLMANALESLVEIHETARSMNLQHRMPRLGVAPGWMRDRTGLAKRISKKLDIDAPDLDRENLAKLMEVKRDEFVKWDARPGNAMIVEGRTVWFDWEDCGRSKALDDLGFMLVDEWTLLDQDAEDRLKARFMPAFNTSLPGERGEQYLNLFGVTHMLWRMKLAIDLKIRDGKWWDREYCLQGDKIGVTPTELSRLILRAKRWADGVDEWKPLTPWLDNLANKLEVEI